MLIFKKRMLKERLLTVRKWYKSPKFALIDLSYGLSSLFFNPYRTCRKFLQKKGEANIYAYGETPYSTYEKIAKEIELSPKDVFIEMGSGRGKGCFWLAHFVKCQVIGIEWIPTFYSLSSLIQKLFCMKNIEFQNRDIQEADLSRATHVYLYGLWPKFKIPSHVKVLTISEPLEGYEVIKSFWVRFPWGRTRAFFQVKKMA